MDDWTTRRKAELEARAPMKRKKNKSFAMIKLDEAAKAFAASGCSKAMVYVWLVHQSKMTGKSTINVPNGVLAKYGVSREIKRRVLGELEAVGLITVDQRPRKTPVVTML
jgi:hypothetical protein